MSALISFRRVRDVAKRIALAIVALAALLMIAGAAFEAVARQTAGKRFPPPGRLVDIGGRRIQIDCRGTGSPTVVLESGLDLFGSLAWAAVHDSIARTTRVCAYSRAGIMWSDPSPLAFSTENVARDLHAALASANEKPPFVMVGHSIGGPYVMAYAKRFGAEVAGVVFVDASHPDQVARMQQATGMPITMQTTDLAFGAAMARTGLVRIVARDIAPPRAPRVVHQASAAYVPTSLAAALREGRALTATFLAAGSYRTLGDRPLVVLTSMATMSDADRAAMHLNEAQAARKLAAWKELQADEASWSTRGRQVLVPDAEHYIQFDRPDLVIAAVREVVCEVRKARTAGCSR